MNSRMNNPRKGGKNVKYKPGTRKTKEPVQEKKHDEVMRLNRYIAASGICSRREADEIIKQGQITINNVVVTEMGTKVNPGDEVRYNDKRLSPERFVYILLNKPKNCVTTLSDPHAKRTVMDIIADACTERIFPVGRLDRNTTGVLLFTNDGELADKLTHPSYNKLKIYHVFLDKILTADHFDAILKGVELEDGMIKADQMSYVEPEDKKQVGIEIHSGKNRVVKRIFENLGYNVEKLDRVYFAGLTKKGLQRGHWRHLTEIEIGMLKKGAYK